MISTNLKRNRGFTLIELLVVLMVIGVLATMAVARYLHARDRGYVAAAVYDLDTVRKLLDYYSVDRCAYPHAAASYQDLQNQLVDPYGNPLGTLPHGNTFVFMSYALDANQDYIVRVRAMDNGGTILVATPETIHRE